MGDSSERDRGDVGCSSSLLCGADDTPKLPARQGPDPPASSRHVRLFLRCSGDSIRNYCRELCIVSPDPPQPPAHPVPRSVKRAIYFLFMRGLFVARIICDSGGAANRKSCCDRARRTLCDEQIRPHSTDGDTIRYRSTLYGDWDLPVSDVRIVGESTDQLGRPDDYFFCFATGPGMWLEASFYADGRDEFLRAFGSETGHTAGNRFVSFH